MQQAQTDFDRIATAIAYIKNNFKDQPSLDEVAAHVHMSPFHFQKKFTAWAGVSPKKFLQYLSVEYAKGILKNRQATLADATFQTGLSGTGRLHDLFINIEGMTPGEYKNGGESLHINYSFAESPFGNMLIASTAKGICYMAFHDDEQEGFRSLQNMFPNAHYKQITDIMQQNALYIFTHDRLKLNEIKLHLKGTTFQLKVWETLLKIPPGSMSTYGNIAESPFGNMLIASTAKGICYMAFHYDEQEGFRSLQNLFPNVHYKQITDLMQQNALYIFTHDRLKLNEIKLHLKGTAFQLKVWETLLKIPPGSMSTYGNIAESIQSPGASRAVGTAIGRNPVAFLIPCHRVIQASGMIGGYMWGPERKGAILGWEAARVSSRLKVEG